MDEYNATETSENYEFGFMEFIKSIVKLEKIENLDENILKDMYDKTIFVLKSIIQQSLKFMDKNNHTSMTADDVKLGMKSKGVAMCLSVLDKNIDADKVIDLRDFVSTPLPKVPLECSLKVECLAINGNHPHLKQLDFYNLQHPASTSKICAGHKRKFSEVARYEKILIPTLSNEQYDYITNTITACMILNSNEEEEDLRRDALENLQTDVCLNPILDNFIDYIRCSVKLNMVHLNIVRLIYLMRMCKALLHNSNIVWESKLDEIACPILTCMLLKNVIPDIIQNPLRMMAISLIGYIFRTFSLTQVLQSRVSNVLSAIISDPSSPLDTMHGAIMCLTELGCESITNFILPHVPQLSKQIYISLLNSTEDKTIALQLEHCLLKCLPSVIQKLKCPPEDIYDFRVAYGSYLGPLLHRESLQLFQKTHPSPEAT